MTDTENTLPAAAAPEVGNPTTETVGDTVADDLVDGAVAPRRRPWWRSWPMAFGVLSTLAVAAIFLIPTPYYLYEPGNIWPTSTKIHFDGHQAFDSEGTISFPTVGIQRATAAGLIQGWFDEKIDVQSEEEAHPGGNVVQDRILNTQMMEDSKLGATVAAFRAVGYPVIVTGSGAFVEDVSPDFPAADVFRQGDVITAIDGQVVTTTADLRPRLLDRPPGAEVGVTIRRKGEAKPIEAKVILGKSDEEPQRGRLGVVVSTAGEGLDLPFGVDIDSGQVTGPSAGLAWTLGLIDRMTPGDLTGGRRVVATGTIEADGSVGTIGGIEQKMAAIIRNGYDVFLYPAGTSPASVKELERMSDGRVELHPVANVDEALAFLVPDGLPPAPPLS